MATKILRATKEKADRSVDRHKPSRMVRLRGPLAERLEDTARENVSTLTAEVNRAVREMLAREGRWPPAP